MKMLTLTLAMLICAPACMGGESTSSSQTVKAEQALQIPAAGTTTDEICRSLMQRQRACSAAFIPALVDARVKADNPPGVAAQDRQMGREALVKEAFDEWASDSSDSAIAALCDDIAQSIRPVKDVELRSAVSTCLAEEGCQAFVSCAVPLSLVRWLK